MPDASPEALLAQMDVSTSRLAPELETLEERLARASAADRARLMASVRALLRADGQETPLRDGLDRLYQLAHAPAETLAGRIVGTTPSELIRRRLERGFVEQDWVEALRDAGLIRTPGALERIRALRRRNRAWEELLISGVLNSISQSLVGIPVALPRFRGASLAPVPPEWIELIRTRGFEAALPLFRERYGRSARVEYALDRGAALFGVVFMPYAAYLLAQQLPFLYQAVGMQLVTEEDLRELEEATFDAERVRAEEFERWSQAYEAFEGHRPDPENPVDRAAMDEQWRVLRAIPDDELRAMGP